MLHGIQWVNLPTWPFGGVSMETHVAESLFLLINCCLSYKCDGWVPDVHKCIMANKCIYFDYIFCKSWYAVNGFRAELLYSGILVLVWFDAILILDAKSIRRDFFPRYCSFDSSYKHYDFFSDELDNEI